MADSEDKPGISRRLTTPFRWVWRQSVRLGRAYLEDLQYLPILRWAVPGVAVIVGLFWLPFDLMPLDRMREWIWEGDAQEFRDALWGISAVVGVLLAMVGILLNYVRTRAINKQALTAEGRLAAEEEGRKTERYVRAVELLGHQEIAVRLGALFSLERLAKDSPTDQPTIMETIAAYVREQAPWPDVKKNSKHAPSTTTEKPKVREDIIAAITIIGRRERSADGEGRIDLSNTNLAGLDFPDARLEGVNFANTNLQKVALWHGQLWGAMFWNTCLEEADLWGTNLSEAKLWNANLQGADLRYANLEGTDITAADFRNCKNLTQDQLEEVRYHTDAHPHLSDSLTMPTERHNLIQASPEDEVDD